MTERTRTFLSNEYSIRLWQSTGLLVMPSKDFPLTFRPSHIFLIDRGYSGVVDSEIMYLMKHNVPTGRDWT